MGFSEAAAESYARMTAITADGDFELPASSERGEVTLQAYIESLVRRDAERPPLREVADAMRP